MIKVRDRSVCGFLTYDTVVARFAPLRARILLKDKTLLADRFLGEPEWELANLPQDEYNSAAVICYEVWESHKKSPLSWIDFNKALQTRVIYFILEKEQKLEKILGQIKDLEKRIDEMDKKNGSV